MDDKVKKELIALCVEIYAASELDWEVTVGGNGTNSAEAQNVAAEILRILGVKQGSKSFKKLVEKKVRELKEEAGEEEDFD